MDQMTAERAGGKWGEYDAIYPHPIDQNILPHIDSFLKTGYINAGGSSIVLTGRRGGRRAIVVVLGSINANTREEHASRLLKDALGALCW